jgi:hypothetical protein
MEALILAIAFVIPVAITAHAADTIEPTNGDRITGTIVELKAGTLVMQVGKVVDSGHVSGVLAVMATAGLYDDAERRRCGKGPAQVLPLRAREMVRRRRHG